MSVQTLEQLVCSVFEQYGKTMYYIQMLEKSIKSIIFRTKLIESTLESKDHEIENIVNNIFKKYSGCTLGQLTGVFKQTYNPPTEIGTVLDRWNSNRILIAHYYLSEKSQNLNNEKQCKDMINELKIFTSEFEFAWRYIFALEESINSKILTPDTLKIYVEMFLKSSIQ